MKLTIVLNTYIRPSGEIIMHKGTIDSLNSLKGLVNIVLAVNNVKGQTVDRNLTGLDYDSLVVLRTNSLPRLRNECIRVCETDYIYFIDDDDYLYPSIWESVKESLDGTELIFLNHKLVKVDSDVVCISDEGLLSDNPVRYCSLLGTNYIFKCSFLKRNELDFPDISKYEDVFLVMDMMRFVTHVNVVGKVCYDYIYLGQNCISSTPSHDIDMIYNITRKGKYFQTKKVF